MPQAAHELEPLVAHISNLLNDASTRLKGLLLLHPFLAQCPLDIVEQKGALWTTIATKVCAQHRAIAADATTVHQPRAVLVLALRCLGQLLRKSVHVPDLAKSMSNTLLAKLIEALLQLPAAVHGEALQLLELTQRLYPGAAMLSRSATESWIVSFVDSGDEQLVRRSGRCLHLLQQTRGGGGTGGTAHKAAWTALQRQLVAELHQLLDVIYANTPEVIDARTDDDEAGAAKFQLPELRLSDEPVQRIAQLVQRFRNVCDYLRSALM